MTILLPHQFTLEDTTGALRASVGFAAILFCPGYLAGTGTNLFGFRERSFLDRIAWAVALSFATAAIFATLAGRVISVTGVAALFGLLGLATIIVLTLDRRRIRIQADRFTLMLGAFLLLASFVVIGELVDIQLGSRLHVSVTLLDQSYRVAFTNAVAQTGIPPLNPLYHPGSAAPLRYYYFWYALCAVCMKLAHVTARQALIASSIWSGIGLVALIALFARHFLGIRKGLHRFILTGALLLTVTGADLLPTLFNLFVNHVFMGELEWWSTDQITSWFDSVLWVPNHTAAMICCATAFLLVWRTQEGGCTRRQRVSARLLAGAAAASAFGLSVYVAAGFAMLMLAWSVRLILRDRNFKLAGRLGGAAVGGMLLSIPFLRELLVSRSGTQQGNPTGPAHMFQFSVRKMIDSDLITGLPALAPLEHTHPVLLDQAVRLVLLLPGYTLELGLYAVVLVLAMRARRRLNTPRHTALFLTISGLLIVSFLRSSVIGNNDFGYRAALLPCFFLLLLAADKLLLRRDDPARKTRNPSISVQAKTLVLTSLLLLGVAGTLFQAAALRFYAPLSTATHRPGFERLPEAAFAARTAYATEYLPPSAIVQSNPDAASEYFVLANMLFAQRASATDAALDCGAVFGGDPAPCPHMRATIAALFGLPAPGAAQAMAVCREFGIDFLAAADSDPAWRNAQGWVWKLPLTAGDQGTGTASIHGFRIVNCNPSIP